jgi:hypothetical protein
VSASPEKTRCFWQSLAEPFFQPTQTLGNLFKPIFSAASAVTATLAHGSAASPLLPIFIVPVSANSVSSPDTDIKGQTRGQVKRNGRPNAALCASQEAGLILYNNR